MEKCKVDLYDYLMDQYPQGMAFEAAASLFMRIARVLAHSHKNGVFHRDIKPENILISRTPCTAETADIKLADFGLATKQLESTQHGCGSIRYMSPECCDVTKSPVYSPEKSDVWALGVVLINLMTGRNPWEKPSANDCHYKRFLTYKHCSFFHRVFGIPKALDTLLVQIFNEDPALRPSVVDLLTSFEDIYVQMTAQKLGQWKLFPAALNPQIKLASHVVGSSSIHNESAHLENINVATQVARSTKFQQVYHRPQKQSIAA
jgi:serine/threonine protein kinase